MIDFTDRTYQALLAAMLARVPNDVDKREGSLIQTALGPAGYALEDAYLTLDRIQRSAFGLTAVGEDLDRKVAEAGLSRYRATAAVRLGEFGGEVPIGSRFSTNTSDPLFFTVTERLGPGRYRLACETAGAVGNHYTGALVAVTHVPGLTSARLTDILIPGDDQEGDEALRARWVEYLNNKPFGGNVADYRHNILSMEGVGGVQVYPTWQGGGTVKCSVVGADFMPAPDTLLEVVQTAIDPEVNQGLGYGLAPIGARVTVCAPETVAVDISAVITAAAGCTLGQLTPAIREEVETCLAAVRARWDVPVVPGTTQYAAVVYRARVSSAMLAVQGAVNVTGLTLNGADEDLQLLQRGDVQQIPILGRLTLRSS